MDRVHAFSRSEIFEDVSPEIVEEPCSPGGELPFKAGRHLFEVDEQAEEPMSAQEGVVNRNLPVRIVTVARPATIQPPAPQCGRVNAPPPRLRAQDPRKSQRRCKIVRMWTTTPLSGSCS
jgi:hypothetical protein